MSNHILVLSGSPRKGGNTTRLTDAFIEGAHAAGKTITLFRVAELNIGPCRACEYCFKSQGVCIQKDDMAPIIDALRQADALVLASPVYYFGVTAQLKLAIDRFFALITIGTSVKRAALLMPCGDASPNTADPSVGMFRHICGYQKWEEAGVIIAPGLHKPDDIVGRPELELARQLGQSL